MVRLFVFLRLAFCTLVIAATTSGHNAPAASSCATEIAPFCNNPFSQPTATIVSQDIPACGCTACDIPSTVLRYQSSLLNGMTSQITINTTVYLLADDSGVPLIPVEDVEENLVLANQAFKWLNISFSPRVILFNNSFLYSRYILPFCRPSDIGNGQCTPYCNVSMTGYDGGDCVNILPNPNCSSSADGKCDDECNFLQFNWDHGDCCEPAVAAEHCRDPNSPLKMWLYQTSMPINVSADATRSFNIYIAQYGQCQWCGASSNFPWWYNFSDPGQQGSVFNSVTIGLSSFGSGLVMVHEFGHTFGLWHVFRFAEGGTAPCGFSCFDGEQYPLTLNGSMITGDLCADTRPTTFNTQCADPPSDDCAGDPWVDTPVHNYMGFSYISPGCANEFTLQQAARMRCYVESYYTNWFL